MLFRLRMLAPLAALLVFDMASLGCDGGSEKRRPVPAAEDAEAAESDPSKAGPSTDGGETGAPCHQRAWAPPRRVDVGSAALEGSPTLTPDERALVFHVREPHDAGPRHELWWATRKTRADRFSTPERFEDVSSDADDAYPALTSDGVTLVFASRRLDPAGPYRLFRAERPDVTVSFSAPVAIEADEAWPAGSLVYPSLTADRTALYFSAGDDEDGHFRVYRSEWLVDGGFGTPVREGAVDDAASSLSFVMSVDRLALFVSRADGEGRYLIHTAVRADVAAPFGPLTPVDALNAGAVDARMGWLSPDGCRAYLSRQGADGEVEIHASERRPEGQKPAP